MSKTLSIKKYRIDEYLARYSKTDIIAKRTELANVLGISESMLRHYRRYMVGDRGSMTTDQLQICAKFFSVSLEEMINQVTVQI